MPQLMHPDKIAYNLFYFELTPEEKTIIRNKHAKEKTIRKNNGGD